MAHPFPLASLIAIQHVLFTPVPAHGMYTAQRQAFVGFILVV